MVKPLNAPFVVLESERLVLRPWLEPDAAALYELARDPAVGPSAGWPVHTSVENSAEIIEGVLSADGTFAVVLKGTGELVGCAGFNFGDAATMPLGDDEGELGYWLGQRFWGRGYATEAAQRVVEHGFCERGLCGIWAAHFEENARSRNVLRKLGFQDRGTMPDANGADANGDGGSLGEKRTTRLMYLPAPTRKGAE
ncbi:MAG: GNAT family N-acetyltransferase [Eggerthellaceae bacterium]|nr:GNAT family N-acetyltransferase [Eggerthellaceae bacterium]